MWLLSLEAHIRVVEVGKQLLVAQLNREMMVRIVSEQKEEAKPDEAKPEEAAAAEDVKAPSEVGPIAHSSFECCPCSQCYVRNGRVKYSLPEMQYDIAPPLGAAFLQRWY